MISWLPQIKNYYNLLNINLYFSSFPPTSKKTGSILLPDKKNNQIKYHCYVVDFFTGWLL